MKTPKSPQWKRIVAEDGSLDCHLKIKRPYDLHFSVWINEPEGKWRFVDLAGWVGPEEEPTYGATVKLPAALPLEDLLARLPEWQDTVIRETARELAGRADFVSQLLERRA